MRLHRLDAVDAAARAPGRLVRESRSFRDGAVPTQDVLRSAPCPGCGNFCSLEEPIAPPQGPSSIFWHCPVCAKPFDAT